MYRSVLVTLWLRGKKSANNLNVCEKSNCDIFFNGIYASARSAFINVDKSWKQVEEYYSE